MRRCAQPRCRISGEALCGGDEDGGTFGCGKSFCMEHLSIAMMSEGAQALLCEGCIEEWTEWAERQWELQAKFLYCLIVAGKSARFANTAVETLLQNNQDGELPLAMLRRHAQQGKLLDVLQASRTGNYGKLMKAITDWDDDALDLDRASVHELEAIHGVGPKTARFFLVWTRPEERVAVLDVHILRWLREHGHKAPQSTPQNRFAYADLEQAFIAEADKRKMTPRQLDEQIWLAGSGAPNRLPSCLFRRGP